MSLTDIRCADALQACILDLLDATCVCQLAACCKELFQSARVRRAAILLARSRLRVCLRSRRFVLQQRAMFVKQECKLEIIGEHLALQEKILQQLQVSPDGIRDLAAATQQALAAVTGQTSVPPAHLQSVQQDLVRMANFVCLLAWRLHLRNRRAGRMQQQETAAAQAQVPVLAGAGMYDDGDVVVVLNPQDEQPLQQEHVQGPALDPQQEPVLEVSVHVEHHTLQQEALTQVPGAQQQAVLTAALPAAPALVSVSLQTDDLGPTMVEVRELLAGLRAIMQPENISLKPSRATLALLSHHIGQQLQNWILPHLPQQ